jgi:aromatic ring-opening dioxygenase catalytic subunit (LigB family)
MPLAYLAGLASVAGQPLRRLTDGIAYGSVSMSSWVLDPPT